jgi:hypothetical protein
MANKYAIVIFSSSTFPRARKRDWSGVAESDQRMGVYDGQNEARSAFDPASRSPRYIP